MFAGDTARAGAHFRRRQAGGVIDIDVTFFQQNAHRAGDTRPVFIIEQAGTDTGLDARQRGQRTHHNLLGGHLKTEDEYRFILQHCGVFDEVHRKCRFTHRRTRRNDNQIRRLQAGGLFVEVVITGVDPGDTIVRLLEQLLDTRHGRVEHIGNVFRPFVFVRTAFGNFKDAGLRQVEQVFAGAPLRIKTGFGDLVRHRYHLTDDSTFPHDIGISADVRRAWRVF